MRLGRLDGRLRYGFAAVCTLLLVIGGRLVQLQGVDHSNYATAAADQRDNVVPLNALRGTITDRFGTPIAYTSDAQDITADPLQVPVTARAHYAQVLSPLIKRPAAAIVTALSGRTHWAPLATALSPATAQKIMDLQLVGIYEQATTQRQYPSGSTAANIVGTVHTDGSGAAGIESEFNSQLAGKNGSMRFAVDSSGGTNPSSRADTVPAVNGSNIKLTIDQNLQFVAQQYLDQAVPEANAKGAQMAVLDAHTGQVLALAASGTFDAANPNTINPNLPINPTVMSAFEPGSVQKSITFAAALQQRLLTPQSHYSVPDSIRTGGVTVRDAWDHSTQTFTATGILAESSNVGTLKIAKQIGPSTWYRYEKLFGVGDKTGIELPGESGGYVPPIKDWSASTFANLPFGQGESMTVLQLASIYQTIANNGVRIPPRIVQSVTGADGSVKVTKQPKGIRVVSPQTSRTLRTMLESVIQPGGTGVKAALPGYRVAGKTGTAQQPDPAHGGAYSSYKNWDTFAGMVPADDPQFVVAIMVDNPAHGVEGGDVAAPLFHHIAAYEVQHAQIAPTGSKSVHVPLEDCAGQDRRYLPANVC
ncbi:peptidoglycan D,D-transpeptidase FtsI family protein [uncultured Jatrophihabitans sp.]|uniref:peptidoglycan D,D-transpeptidase FtsI family protein n=1 Tax=uncultured Jatrophihabitans sp. TaxID=1610747 RepID=UPI0035CBE8E3